jgi:hypothetical protein
MVGEIGGEEVSMLVDTGSAVTLIHRRIWDKIQECYGPVDTGPPVIAVNSQPLSILVQCVVEMRVAGIYASHPVLVADDISHECLLGVEFLGANNFTIELGNGCLSSRVNHVSAPVFVKLCSTQNVVCRVSFAKTVIIPARHEMVIPAKVSAPDKKARVNFPGIVKPTTRYR